MLIYKLAIILTSANITINNDILLFFSAKFIIYSIQYPKWSCMLIINELVYNIHKNFYVHTVHKKKEIHFSDEKSYRIICRFEIKMYLCIAFEKAN